MGRKAHIMAQTKKIEKKACVSIVTATRMGKTAVQVRWLGDARPTDEDKAAMRACGLRFYKDADGACWASFKLKLEDVKALIQRQGYDLDADATAKAVAKTTKKTTSKKSPKKQEPTALEMLANLDPAKLEKLLKIAELLG
jgi:hypothetical protein